MEDKTVIATELGPEIVLRATGSISISGRSMAEDSSAYYKEAFKWIEQFIEEKGSAKITLEIDLVYFNSSSAKQLLKLLLMIKNAEKLLSVKWFYMKNSHMLLERGKELSEIIELDFDYCSK